MIGRQPTRITLVLWGFSVTGKIYFQEFKKIIVTQNTQQASLV